MQQREVEYYRLWEDNTWDTDFIDVPFDTQDDQMDVAIRAATAAIHWRGEVPIIVGLYCSNDDSDEAVDDSEAAGQQDGVE